MKRSFLLAIGITVAFLWTGNPFDVSASRPPGAGPDASKAGGRAALVEERLKGIVREVTAYNVGVRGQTSGDPCVGAKGHNLCVLVERGHKICAANFVSLGTILRIEKHGECLVLDRLNRRYAHRVDIAMGMDEVKGALEFGLQRRVVLVKD